MPPLSLDVNVASDNRVIVGAGSEDVRPALGLPVGSPAKLGRRVNATGTLSVNPETLNVVFTPTDPAQFARVVELAESEEQA